MLRLEQKIKKVNKSLAQLYDEIGRETCQQAQNAARSAARSMSVVKDAETTWKAGGFNYLFGFWPHNKAVNFAVINTLWAIEMHYANYRLDWNSEGEEFNTR